MSRLIVVSNRVNPPGAAGEETVGGLAMALAAALRQYSGLWFGWSGKTTPEFSAYKARLTEEIRVESIRAAEMGA